MQKLSYIIDAGNRLVRLSSGWERFAIANGAPDLSPYNVLGRNLDSFITGAETREVFGMFLTRLRQSDREVVLPFRCDAPDRRRLMEMTVLARPDGSIEFRTRVMREEVRDSVALFDSEQPRLPEMIGVCSWCKKVRTPLGEWLEVEEALQRMRLFEHEEVPGLTHTMCDACLAAFEARHES